MREVTTEDLQRAEQGLVKLREQQAQIATMVARQEGIVLFLRERLNGDAESVVEEEETPAE